MKAYAISLERESEVYPVLLDWAEAHAATFHFVLRHGLVFSNEALAFIRDLESDTIRIRVTREWAGTSAMDEARVPEFRITPSSMSVLRRAQRIFEWCFPERPEDLAFFTADRRCVFNSVSHHDEAWVCDDNLRAWIELRAPGALIESEHEASAVTFEGNQK